MARSVKGNGFPSPSGGVTCGPECYMWKRGAWRRLTFSEKKRTPSGTSIGFSHYRARTVVTVEVRTTSDRSEVPQGVPVASSHGQWFGSSSPSTWGPRVADVDMDLVLQQLFPARGLRIKEPTMTEQEQHRSKCPSDQDKMVRLQKFAKTGDGGKGKAGSSAAAPSSRAGPTAPDAKTPSDLLEAWVSCPREDRSAATVPSSRSRREDVRP
ncbi:hypothetical protein TIFTF001_023224 [Ficus carica]|uniref:Uncharacterized protein n=1 Tax=Ficus carica TaxID=3494 RepID=A0AA88DK52_FICCA|nr:hypothetical protein TIFTF001_023224 [Ficus carica]